MIQTKKELRLSVEFKNLELKRKLKTIIVDDHKIFGEGFCSLLESNNFRVNRIFQNSKKALNYIKKIMELNLFFQM